jgi:SAM-dependent methyltransferase
MDTQRMDAGAFDAFEASGWESQAGGYTEFFVPMAARVVPTLLDAAGVKHGTRVLDVACGPGHVAAACAGRGASVVGLDVAHEMVAIARGRYPGLDFRQGDAQEPPFEDETMDAIVGNLAILHFGRPEHAVAEFARVLAPGGALSLSTWDHPERSRLVGAMYEAVAELGVTPLADLPPGPPFFRFADEAEFAKLLAGAGLGEIRVQTVGFTYRMKSVDEAWDGLRRGTVRMRALVFDQPEDVRERVRDVFTRRLEEHASPDGGLDIPVSFKVASGIKGRADESRADSLS